MAKHTPIWGMRSRGRYHAPGIGATNRCPWPLAWAQEGPPSASQRSPHGAGLPRQHPAVGADPWSRSHPPPATPQSRPPPTPASHHRHRRYSDRGAGLGIARRNGSPCGGSILITLAPAPSKRWRRNPERSDRSRSLSRPPASGQGQRGW
jgi:hypothetical protein